MQETTDANSFAQLMTHVHHVQKYSLSLYRDSLTLHL